MLSISCIDGSRNSLSSWLADEIEEESSVMMTEGGWRRRETNDPERVDIDIDIDIDLGIEDIVVGIESSEVVDVAGVHRRDDVEERAGVDAEGSSQRWESITWSRHSIEREEPYSEGGVVAPVEG